MEPTRFDDLTRRLSAGTTRRSIVRGLAIGLLGSASAARAVSAGQPKVTMCHHTTSPTNAWIQITIARSAVADHLAAGDQVCGSAQTCDRNQGCTCASYSWMPASQYDHCYDDRTSGDLSNCAVTTTTGIEGAHPVAATCTWNCGADESEVTCDDTNGCACYLA